MIRRPFERLRVRRHTAIHCHTLQHTATHHTATHHTATHCNTLQHSATLCNAQCRHTRSLLKGVPRYKLTPQREETLNKTFATITWRDRYMYFEFECLHTRRTLSERRAACGQTLCVAVCCRVLPCVAVCCSVLQCVAVSINNEDTLLRVAVSLFQCVAMCLHYSTTSPNSLGDVMK